MSFFLFLTLVFLYNLFLFGIWLTFRAISSHRCISLYWLLCIWPII